MIIGPSPFKVVKTGWHTWFCEGPYQSGEQWKTEEEANHECSLLNSVYNTGYFANVDQRRLAELESDVANAYRCAQDYSPDYPWDSDPDKSCQASTAVWACGESYKGVTAACNEWRRLFKHFAPKEYDALLELVKKKIKAYNDLVKKLEEEEEEEEKENATNGS
jgi:hypothetical protein